jgi:ABC-2 type transport system ATP-binding protein
MVVNMRSHSAASISCRGLTKTFGASTVVDDVSFDAPAGAVTGFVGANGAGKTTTMRMVLGLVRPTAGEALVQGLPYGSHRRPRTVVGAVVDGPGAHPSRTAATHLRIVATSAQLPSERVDEVLELVGLGDNARQRVGTFSMGMLQRLALAGALLGDPPILMLDEPANGLDPPGILWMRGLLRRLADEGRAVLVSSHLLTELATVADRVVIIDRGRVLVDDDLPTLLRGHDGDLERFYFELLAERSAPMPVSEVVR